MSLPKPRGKGGRPSKGERRFIAARVPGPHAEELFARADARGISLSEFLNDMIARELARPDTVSPTQQEALRISA
jgi:hypothetical protein